MVGPTPCLPQVSFLSCSTCLLAQVPSLLLHLTPSQSPVCSKQRSCCCPSAVRTTPEIQFPNLQQ